MAQIHPFSTTILNWYSINARNLPWRQTKDPYLIWLSEVILQQTRVQQGLPYFEKFRENFPNVNDLANASEDFVLRLWQGLGYYSRARNLHKTAKFISSHFKGEFPNTYIELLQLPGIGPYSAAAISSFAFDEHQAVVDGNVFRILARYFGLKEDIADAKNRKIFSDLANDLMPKGLAAQFNQAIMEFGSLQCSPIPSCGDCPLRNSCFAFSNKQVNELPVKTKKIKITQRFFHYFVIKKNNSFLIQKRLNKDIWQQLFEFYLLEQSESQDLDNLLENDKFLGNLPGTWEELRPMKPHQLSHQKIFCKAWRIQIPDNFELEKPQQMVWKTFSEFENLGKPVLVDHLLIDNL
jgi:A/G-specific adenine glycosylase